MKEMNLTELLKTARFHDKVEQLAARAEDVEYEMINEYVPD